MAHTENSTICMAVVSCLLVLLSTILDITVDCVPRGDYFSRTSPLPDATETSHREPVFSAIWNVPSYQCLRFGVVLPLEKYNIQANGDGNATGEVITLLNKAHLGLYPHYDAVTREPVNGGLPQLGNLSLHLEKVVEDVRARIPDPNYSGTCVIDWEEWNLSWEQTIGIYRDKSLQHVKTRHPEWNSDLVRRIAVLELEQAAKSYVDSTLRLVKQMRPHARWGFYHYPYCYNIDTPGGKCDPVYTRTNDEMVWFFDSVTAIHPSIYLHENEEYPRTFVKGCMEEAYRMRALSRDKHKPVVAYARFNYSHSGLYYTMEDLNHTVLQVAEMGANGVIFWSDHNDTKSRQSCMELQSYLNTTLGPLVKEVTSAASACSQRVCSGNGRCVDDIFNCAIRTEKLPKEKAKRTCTCSCFRGWEGPICSKKSQKTG